MAETGLNQNVNRDYDPLGGGRYIESDPIGLNAGSYSTYKYSRANPLTFSDPSGLMPNPAEATCVEPAQPICWLGIIADVATWLGAGGAGAAAMVTPSDTDQSHSAAASKPFCPTDDFCIRNAKRLNIERNLLIDAQALLVPENDKESLIALNNDILKFNREVAAHNKLCPGLLVLPLPTLGNQGHL
jgi:RHS repeat-associated protein